MVCEIWDLLKISNPVEIYLMHKMESWKIGQERSYVCKCHIFGFVAIIYQAVLLSEGCQLKKHLGIKLSIPDIVNTLFKVPSTPSD